MSTDYSEILCESMEIISKSIIDGVKYDSTIECTIIDDSDAKNGVYRVSNGSTNFIAYSSEKYSKGTKVYVTIPNGDYNNDKIIIGKVASASSQPYNYSSPLDELIDITGNLVSAAAASAQPWGLLANEGYQSAYIDTDGNTQPAKNASTSIFLFSIGGGKEYSGFSRLGVSAEFKSWLHALECMSGDYGLRLDVLIQSSDILGNKGTHIKQMFLSTKDMIGNPYNFETYFIQEKLFDISDFEAIVGIDVYFYQNTDFKNKKNEYLPWQEVFDNEFDENGDPLTSKMSNNLFVQNISISIGYSTDDVSGDFVQLYSFDPTSYDGELNVNHELNQKSIILRWMHENDEGKKYPIEVGSSEEFEIRWYRYNFGQAASDSYCGVNWVRIPDLNGEVLPEGALNQNIIFEENSDYLKTFNIILNPDIELAEEKIKAIILYGPADSYIKASQVSESDFVQDPSFYYELIGDSYVQLPRDALYEDYKDSELYYVTKSSRDIFKSNILTFINEKDTFNIDEIVNSLSALQLHCQDIGAYENNNFTRASSYGNYFLYDQANRLIDNSQASIERQIGFQLMLEENNYVNFDYSANGAANDTSNALALKNIELLNRVEWRFPAENTMIVYNGDTEELSLNNGVYSIVYSKEDEPGAKSMPAAAVIGTNTKNYGYPMIFSYYIKRYYSSSYSNNWVECIVDFDGNIYRATQELTFGQSGLMGSECNFVLDFEDDRTAITIGKDGDGNFLEKENINVYARLYNSENKLITDLSPYNVEWSWHRNSANNLKVDQDEADPFKAILTIGDETSVEEIYILKATLTGYQNEASQSSYPVVAYLPIPLRNSAELINIQGPDRIIYNSDGTPNYSNNLYIMHVQGAPAVIYETDEEGNEILDEKGNPIVAFEYPTIIYDYLNFKTTLSYYGASSNENYNDFPILKEETEYASGNLIGYRLKPAEYYSASSFERGSKVCAVVYNDGAKIWTQPILIIQNRYFSQMINDWDGSLVVDEENNSILSAKIAAGSKNSNNEFSGILLGDWRQDNGDFDDIQTGLYGFSDGVMTYSLDESGVVKIGSKSRGQIVIDGESSTIQSANYLEDRQGAYFDLLDGKLFLIQNQDSINNYNENATDLGIYLNAAATTYPLRIGSNFKVNWDGSIIATNGTFSGTLQAASGTFSGTLQAASGTFRGTLTSTTLEGVTIKAKSLIESSTIKGSTIIGSRISGGIYDLYLDKNTITSNSFSYTVVTSWDSSTLLYYYRWIDTDTYDAIDITGQEQFDAVQQAIKDTSTMDGYIYKKNESSSSTTYSWDGIFNFYEAEEGGLVATIGGMQGEISDGVKTPNIGFKTYPYTSPKDSLSYYPSFIIESCNVIKLIANETKVETSSTLPAGRVGGIYLESTGTNIWFRSSSFPESSAPYNGWYKLGEAYFG